MNYDLLVNGDRHDGWPGTIGAKAFRQGLERAARQAGVSVKAHKWRSGWFSVQAYSTGSTPPDFGTEDPGNV